MLPASGRRFDPAYRPSRPAGEKPGRVDHMVEKEPGGNMPFNNRQHQNVQPDTYTQVVTHTTCLAGSR
jgi:hypothetical protein